MTTEKSWADSAAGPETDERGADMNYRRTANLNETIVTWGCRPLSDLDLIGSAERNGHDER